jgi:hypothetical protein
MFIDGRLNHTALVRGSDEFAVFGHFRIGPCAACAHGSILEPSDFRTFFPLYTLFVPSALVAACGRHDHVASLPPASSMEALLRMPFYQRAAADDEQRPFAGPYSGAACAPATAGISSSTSQEPSSRLMLPFSMIPP